MLLAHAEMRLTDLEYHYCIYKVAYLIITTIFAVHFWVLFLFCLLIFLDFLKSLHSAGCFIQVCLVNSLPSFTFPMLKYATLNNENNFLLSSSYNKMKIIFSCGQ